MDVWFSTSGRQMAKNALNDEDIDFIVIEMGGQAVAQRMTGDIKGDLNGRIEKNFLKVIFAYDLGSDQAGCLFDEGLGQK